MTKANRDVFKNFIAGKWVESNTGNTYQITNPARKSVVLGSFQSSNKIDAERAVVAAEDALRAWADTPAPSRASVLFKALEIMGKRSDEIAQSITDEEGTPILDAKGEVRRAMNII